MEELFGTGRWPIGRAYQDRSDADGMEGEGNQLGEPDHLKQKQKAKPSIGEKGYQGTPAFECRLASTRVHDGEAR